MASAACAQRAGFEFAVDRGERIVERRHEDAADGVDDQRTLAVLGVDQRRPAARRAPWKIRRTNEPRRALDEHQRLALVPGMIAERHRVGAGVDEFLIDRLGDAEAAGRVLAIDDDEIERPVADHAGQYSETAVRPDLPTTSPTKRMRKSQTPEIEHLRFR